MTDLRKAHVEAAFAEFVSAMLDGDPDALQELCAPGFSLTHITGYRQPGEDWFSEMRDGQFVYNGIDIRALEVSLAGGRARVTARTMTDAGVYRRRADWPLQLTLDYAWQDGRWIALRAVATLWG